MTKLDIQVSVEDDGWGDEASLQDVGSRVLGAAADFAVFQKAGTHD